MRKVKDDRELLAESLPETDFAAHALAREADFDRVMIGLFSILLVGTIVLLLSGPFSPWLGAAFFLAFGCFIHGAAHCLAHIRLTSKLFSLSESIVYDAAPRDDLLKDDELLSEAYRRIEGSANFSFHSQIESMTFGVLAAALGLTAHFWDYAWRAGTLAVGLFVLMVGSSVLVGFVRGIRSRRQKRNEER